MPELLLLLLLLHIKGTHASPELKPAWAPACFTCQVRPGGAERQALGVVCRTGFWTAKGQVRGFRWASKWAAWQASTSGSHAGTGAPARR